MILSLYDFARANPDPEKWLDGLAVNYEAADNLGENHLYQAQIKPTLVEIAATAEHLLAAAKQFADQSPLMEKQQHSFKQRFLKSKKFNEFWQQTIYPSYMIA